MKKIIINDDIWNYWVTPNNVIIQNGVNSIVSFSELNMPTEKRKERNLDDVCIDPEVLKVIIMKRFY